MNKFLVLGGLYRLAKDVNVGNCVLPMGGVFTYSSGGYSPYDDSYIYHFIDLSGEKVTCISRAELSLVDMENFEMLHSQS